MSEFSGISFASSGLSRHKYGTSGIQYSSDGRILSGDQLVHDQAGRDGYRYAGTGYHTGHARTSNRYAEDRSYARYYDEQRKSPREYPTGRKEKSSQSRRKAGRYDTGFDRPTAGSDIRDDRYPTRRYYHRSASADNTINSVPLSRGSYKLRDDERDQTTWKRAPKRKSQEVQEDELRSFGMLFTSTGFLIIIGGLLNILFCAEHHYYVAWWGGFLVLQFAVGALSHRGQYKAKGKNAFLFSMGVLALLAAFVGTALVLDKLMVDFRMLIYSEDPNLLVEAANSTNWTISLGDTISQEARVWTCFGVDCALLFLFVCCYMIIIPLIYASNRYWEANCTTTGTCEPWRTPRWFNPFTQIISAEMVAFLGIIVRYAATYQEGDIKWPTYWVPVWAAGVMAIAACFSISAFKRPDSGCKIFFGMLLQLLAGFAMGGAVTISINGIVDNASFLESDATFSNEVRQQVIVSALIYGLTAVAALPNVIYCMVVMGRLYTAGSQNRLPYRDDRSFVSASTSPPSVRHRLQRQHQMHNAYKSKASHLYGGDKASHLYGADNVAHYPVYPNYFSGPVQTHARY